MLFYRWCCWPWYAIPGRCMFRRPVWRLRRNVVSEIRTTPLFSNSMTETLSGQKKDSDITGIIGEIPDVACRAGASVKGMHLRYISVETAHFLRILQRYLICRMNNLTYCCTLVHDSSRSPNWDNACEHYIFGMRRILI